MGYWKEIDSQGGKLTTDRDSGPNEYPRSMRFEIKYEGLTFDIGFKWSDGRYGYTLALETIILNPDDRYRIKFYLKNKEEVNYEFSPLDESIYIDGNSYNLIAKKDDPIKLILEQYILVPPSVPEDLKIPTEIKEGYNFSISWWQVMNADKYELERSVNGGSYTKIHDTVSTSILDIALATWNTVQYRVRSKNVDGYSAYAYSNVAKITHFPEMELRINGALKTSDMGWVKVNGALREIENMWVKINGIVKEVK